MAISMQINGTLSLEFLDLQGNPVSRIEQAKIKMNIVTGEYVVMLSDGVISQLGEPNKTLYKIKFEVLDDTEFNFDFEEEEE